MATSPLSPRLLRGAIVALDPANPLASVILFQYNPETMTRSLTPRTAGADLSAQGKSDLDPTEAKRISGPPKESISLKMAIDATDRLEQADTMAVTLGIHPQIATLEMLMYPKTLSVLTNSAMSKAGTMEIVAMEAPLTLFIWGGNRILPVRVDRMDIEELAYDVNLNPIRADVDLTLEVLSYKDLKLASLGGALFMAHQVSKELMATMESLKNVSSIAKGVAGSIPLL
ncbi:MAG: hypothetical protein F6J94_14825 [Moorea sp. SIO1F2]|uniref:hypothetical protein n=1 Tax=unclassified Moorena TaxID=2683338 RepID=UPI0013B9C890|nr:MULTISPECIES: hypothetical protein [unclassified Moorena]NEO06244.1 hypothetical protein [Moorena sp. SIO3I8]NET83151.1 hypothetical protein [Moorena sp. SIO1F2]